MSRVFLGLGTNLGDRRQNLSRAIAALSARVRLLRQSSVYETKAWGFTDQADFLNQVIEIETDLTPLRLLNFIKKTETALGRVQNFRWGPRLIDIDILFFDNLVRSTQKLQIPHPRISERAFVLVPMAELEPDFVHPVLNETIRELLNKTDTDEVRLCK